MLTDLEAAAVAGLLDSPHPVAAALRRQAGRIAAVRREFTGAGFFTDFTLPPDEPPAPSAPPVGPAGRLVVGGLDADLGPAGEPCAFLLLVEAGRLRGLEGAACGDAWPAEAPARFARSAGWPFAG